MDFATALNEYLEARDALRLERAKDPASIVAVAGCKAVHDYKTRQLNEELARLVQAVVK